ncbi:DUF1837 domain-containing protein [Peristeroidobacter soli]|uniref:DUF1837 domain-containing protein n=1 Tax=Peristeroidobacter soli TaxID=2497877 RepID=UPI001C378BC9|nr:DUF1837 domain-containing protein [Peristeroidobacter soli]
MSVTGAKIGVEAAAQEEPGLRHGLDTEAPTHLQYLSKTNEKLVTLDGRAIDVWRLAPSTNDAHLSEWATRFREHYCLDREIDALRDGTGLSRAQYLAELVFPDKSAAPGPSIRAGDFAEILVADYVEYLLGYWVPRCRYAEKAVRNESVKGVDILGFKMPDPSSESPSDELFAFEVKAQLADGKYSGRLQVAIDDSRADYFRRAMTLNATKRRLMHQQDARAGIVQRFQNPSDRPYLYRSGAAAILVDGVYDRAEIELSTTAEHPNQQYLSLIVIRGADLMSLVHAMYERAANEA